VTAAERPEVPLEIPTERLVLRAPHPDHAQEINDAIRESFTELRQWMNWAQQIPSLEESRAQQERGRAAFLAREDLPLFLFRGERIVGGSGLHRIDWTVPRFEIGYWVRTEDARQGYVTEAVKAIESFAFEALGARRIEIRTHTRNLRSHAIPKRLDYQLEGILRQDCRHVDGRLRDTAVYAKVR
jgi:RimJ/RimL family protein N-acetyltransferase